VYKIQYHIVWVTRFRRKVLVPGVQRYLRVKLEEVRKWYPDWEYVAIGMEVDHVHLHMVIPPRYAVSWVVGTLKQNTSRALSEKFAFLKDVYWDEDGIWTKGYFVSTVGANEAIIRRYVEMQGKEDAGQAELEF
jgi:putative transposase